MKENTLCGVYMYHNRGSLDSIVLLLESIKGAQFTLHSFPNIIKVMSNLAKHEKSITWLTSDN